MAVPEAGPRFDVDAFYGALDERRSAAGMGWYDLAGALWDQSSRLNESRPGDHPLCGGALQRQRGQGATSCQYALFGLRWLGRPPEDFLTGDVVDVGDAALPAAGPGARLRFDLPSLHQAVDTDRRERGLTWAALARGLGTTPSRLTNLRTATRADMDLVMRLTQWLRRPAADFVHAAEW